MKRIKFKGHPTTRLYPRTLDEAFPNSVDRAEWFYPPEKRPMTVTEMLMTTWAISTIIGLAYYFAQN